MSGSTEAPPRTSTGKALFIGFVLLVLFGAIVSKISGYPIRHEQPAPSPTAHAVNPAASSKLDGRVSVLLTVTFSAPTHRPGKNAISVFYNVAGVPTAPQLVHDSPWSTVVRVLQGQEITLAAVQLYTDEPIPPSEVTCYINRVTQPLGSIDQQVLRAAGALYCQAPLGWV